MDVDESSTEAEAAVVVPAEASSSSLSSSATNPRRITKLSDETINRIAAGEVVQRPSSALKELLENAIDAGSTNIKVAVKDGGLKLLSIQDNGHGIHKADLPLLCERFATSKLKTYDDLSSIATYGFRGEALASISHVAHLTVTTKTRDAPCGFKARYVDGKLVPLIANSTDAEPRPTAANDGTLLLVEDLFYNTPSRRKGLRSPADEYSRILDVVSKYAIHNAGIAMSCKKSTSNSSDLNTAATSTKLEVIGQVYGDILRRETRELAFNNKEFLFSVQGHISGQNYSAKKATYIFFINNRLVDCSPLRRNLDTFYQTILPKGGCPFVYLSLQIQPDRVDVNVSPTKNEVHFLDQEDIIEVICNEMQRKLAAANDTRTYTVQTLLPGADAIAPPVITQRPGNQSATQNTARPTGTSTAKVPAQRLVRTDATAQTLDAMFGQSQSTQAAPANPRKRSAAEMTQAQAEPAVHVIDSSDSDDEGGNPLDSRSKYRSGAPASQAVQPTQPVRKSKIPMAACDLTSVRELREEIARDVHKELESIVKSHTFVGVIDIDIGQSMLQYGTKLYLVNHNTLMEELFYQLSLRQFGAMGKFHLNPPPSVRELLSIALEDEPNHEQSGLSAEQIIDIIHDRLIERAEMLDEYFSLAIDADAGTVRSIPMILPGWSPDLDKLPLLLLRLGTEVDWMSEKGCFSTLLREMAFFNTADPLPHSSTLEDNSDDVQIAKVRLKQKQEQQTWQLQHVVFHAMRYLQPPIKLLDSKAIVHVASLENLYKVFERC